MEFLDRCRSRLLGIVAGMRHTLAARPWSPPTVAYATGTAADLLRGRAQLLAENAPLRQWLRQQLIVLRRSVADRAVKSADRAVLVLLAGRVRAWRQALLPVRPDTLLRWRRAGSCALWRRKSRPGPGRPPLPADTVALIRRLAADNPRWGAERIRSELGKLGLRGQSWGAFLRNHAQTIWACDFLPVTDALFQPLCAFSSSRWPRGGSSTSARRATRPMPGPPSNSGRPPPAADTPRYLIRDNDGKFGAAFARVVAASGITILRTPLVCLSNEKWV